MAGDQVLSTVTTAWGVRLVLDRPDKLNALNGGLVAALTGALDAAEANSEVRVIVIEGAGRAFCAGYDLTEEAEGAIGGPAAWRDLLAADVAATLRLLDSPKPVIAQCTGTRWRAVSSSRWRAISSSRPRARSWASPRSATGPLR